jgi:hypothetical protein
VDPWPLTCQAAHGAPTGVYDQRGIYFWGEDNANTALERRIDPPDSFVVLLFLHSEIVRLPWGAGLLSAITFPAQLFAYCGPL